MPCRGTTRVPECHSREKYQHLAPCTVAFLWQFPPSWVYSDEAYQRMERLVEYLASNKSGVQEARHIVDFRDGSWYREDVYEFLKKHRWCLAWLHLNNADGWASNLPSGWTDRVQTTNFCFCRLFGPDGRTHGIYDNKFLHELFDSCPMGTTSYVLFGNKARPLIAPWLKELEAGGRLAFRGLEKERGWDPASRSPGRGGVVSAEQRAVVHRLAHQLGFINTSKADPEGCSARMVCVLRPHTTSAQPPSAESASAEVAASSRETRSAFVAGPPTSPPARRWRRSAVKRGGAGVGQETERRKSESLQVLYREFEESCYNVFLQNLY
eukprot:g22466.t1